MSAHAPTLERIERQALRGFAAGSEVYEADAFRVFLWSQGDIFYRDRATPVRRARAWAPAIGAMRAVFAAAGRVPRLEFLTERWPDLAPALDGAGFRRELTAPVLATSPAAQAFPAPPEIRLLDAAAAPDLLADLLTETEIAFGMPRRVPEPHEVDRFRRELAAGTCMTALCMAEGRPIGSASLIGVGDDAELAGVWTAAAYRCRGIAQAVCSSLLSAFAERGGELVWLSAGNAASLRLYRRLGFGPVGTQLHYSRP